MRSEPKCQNNTPRAVIFIANAFLWIGGGILSVSILILLLGLIIFLNEADIRSMERPGLLWVLSIMLGVPGVILSATTIVSSVGLRKMRKWGLWCSYCTMAVLATLYVVIRGNQFAINTSLDLCGHLMALTIVAIEIYLTRIYWQYFTRA
jgi:hypothetical protein